MTDLRDPASRREVLWLAGALALALAIRLAYVIATQGHPLAGDEVEYDATGRLMADGKWFWGIAPNGIAHPTLWKAPLYGSWVGAWYSLFGKHPDAVLIVQTLLGPVNVALTWVLGRRMFGSRVGLAAAFGVAVFPLAWEFETRMYSEALATPLTLATLWVVLEREPTPRRAMGAGVLLGVLLLLRPSSVFLLAAVALAWWLGAGARRGTLLLGLTMLVAAAVVAPWTYRNHRVSGAFVPISVQDAAAYGTFNDVSAHDPTYPWAWRPIDPRALGADTRGRRLSDVALRRVLLRLTRQYIRRHPDSLPKAFFWNGLSRLWDVRRPARVLDEVRFEGRTRGVTIAGLAMYYVLLPLAVAGLWRHRRRRALVVCVLAAALAASFVYTADSGTRYRAPLEPLIAILACGAFAPQARSASGDDGHLGEAAETPA